MHSLCLVLTRSLESFGVEGLGDSHGGSLAEPTLSNVGRLTTSPQAIGLGNWALGCPAPGSGRGSLLVLRLGGQQRDGLEVSGRRRTGYCDLVLKWKSPGLHQEARRVPGTASLTPFFCSQFPPSTKNFQEAQSQLNQAAAGLNQSANELVQSSRGTSQDLARASGKFGQDFNEFLQAGVEMAGQSQVRAAWLGGEGLQCTCRKSTSS